MYTIKYFKELIPNKELSDIVYNDKKLEKEFIEYLESLYPKYFGEQEGVFWKRRYSDKVLKNADEQELRYFYSVYQDLENTEVIRGDYIAEAYKKDLMHDEVCKGLSKGLEINEICKSRFSEQEIRDLADSLDGPRGRIIGKLVAEHDVSGSRAAKILKK